jgi:hypothetical protein
MRRSLVIYDFAPIPLSFLIYEENFILFFICESRYFRPIHRGFYKYWVSFPDTYAIIYRRRRSRQIPKFFENIRVLRSQLGLRSPPYIYSVHSPLCTGYLLYSYILYSISNSTQTADSCWSYESFISYICRHREMHVIGTERARSYPPVQYLNKSQG